MNLAGLPFLTFLVAFCFINCRADSDIDQPISSPSDFEDDQVLDSRRGDIEIDDDTSFQGYFYPKPQIPFELPDFITVKAGGKSYVPPGQDRVKRSERRRIALPTNYKFL